MLIAGILLILFTLELFYFKVAGHFNITDTPNNRSSHAVTTLRGGGIIFSVSVFIYFLVFGWRFPFFATGLLALTIVSFADDIKHQRRRIRIAIQLLATILLLVEATFPISPFLICAMAMLLIVAMLNAFNFMDGINGMTSLYSFVVLAGLFFINRDLHAFDEMLLVCVGLSNLVFAFFNVRKAARCFAGDVGSISMAYILMFFTVSCIVVSGNPIFLLFFTVYAADVVITILQRMFKRETILDAHRQHLFQYLSNEKKMPQLLVSGIYMFIQLLITAGVIMVWKKDSPTQFGYAVVVILFVFILYATTKYRILKRLKI